MTDFNPENPPEWNDFFDITQKLFSQNTGAFFEAWAKNWHTVSAQSLEGIDNHTREAAKSWWDSFLQDALDKGQLNQTLVDQLQPLDDIVFPLNLLIPGLMFIFLQVMYFGSWMQPVQAQIARSVNSENPVQLPDVDTLIRAAFIAPEKISEIRQKLREHGLDDDNIDLSFLSNYALTPLDYISTLYLRQLISEETMYERMRELGFTDTRIAEMVQAWEVLPGPQDLLTMVAHEVFEPDSVSKLGLADEFPEDQVRYLEKQGISRYWAMNYWISHWAEPSISQGYEMYHRRIIDDDTLDLLFRTVEIPPFWREKLKQAAFNPLTRVDVRRMHDLGVLNDEELVAAYMDVGFSPENAARMSEFTVRYNQRTGLDLTRTDIENGYRDHLMSQSDAKALLVELGYDENEADYYLARVDFDRQQSYLHAAIENTHTRYIENLISSLDARQTLNTFNLPGTEVDLLLQTWDLEKYEDRKLPTKAELKRWYLSDLITQTYAEQELRRLGYGTDYVTLYLREWNIDKKGND